MFTQCEELLDEEDEYKARMEMIIKEFEQEDKEKNKKKNEKGRQSTNHSKEQQIQK